MHSKISGLTMVSALALSAGSAAAAPNVEALTALGKQVFFDEISVPQRQSCATCHVAANGFTGGVAAINLDGVAITGANPHTVGNRKPPTAAYAASVPNLTGGFFGPNCSDAPFGLFCIGGVFWDGRATGTAIGSEVFGGDTALTSAYAGFLGPLADQALGPCQPCRTERAGRQHRVARRRGGLRPCPRRALCSAVPDGVGPHARLYERGRPRVQAHRGGDLCVRALHRNECLQLGPRYRTGGRRGSQIPPR